MFIREETKVCIESEMLNIVSVCVDSSCYKRKHVQ